MDQISDEDILPLSLKHSFWTWSAQGKVAPSRSRRAKGVYFWDTDGKRYLDFNSMTMCVNIGHGDERVIEAIVAQARELPYRRAADGDPAARRAGQAAQRGHARRPGSVSCSRWAGRTPTRTRSSWRGPTPAGTRSSAATALTTALRPGRWR